MSLESTSKAVFISLVETIRSASVLANQDINFYKSLDSSVAKDADLVSDRLLQLLNRLLSAVGSGDFQQLTDLESVQDNWRNIGDVLDTLYEKTDIALDNRNFASAVQTEKSPLTVLTNAETTNVHATVDMPKPQLKFETKPDNSPGVLDKPRLTRKPHALTPLDLTLHTESDEKGILRTFYEHPYKEEIAQCEFSDQTIKEPIMFSDWNSAKPVWVETVEDLENMLGHLVKADVISVDLEHHNHRSYFGFVCLMQISTRHKDFIIDTLILRNELNILNTVFTNPKIVKVFHGAHMDIIWLQRDFGLYVVNLFDTFCASKALGFPKHGLQYLLETYAHFKTSKKFQMADWRIRPLPVDMVKYAEADTHFLCYIYDVLRNEAIKRNVLKNIIDESKKVALLRYERTNPSPYKNLVSTYKINHSQEIILQEVYAWRDKLARDLDESPRYIIPNRTMIALCIQAPTTIAGVLKAAENVTGHIRTAANEVANLIKRAKQKVEEMETFLDKQPNSLEAVKNEVDYTISSIFNNYLKLYRIQMREQKHLFDMKEIELVGAKHEQKESTFFGANFELSKSKDVHVDRLDVVRNINLTGISGSDFGLLELQENSKRMEKESQSNDETGTSSGILVGQSANDQQMHVRDAFPPASNQFKVTSIPVDSTHEAFANDRNSNESSMSDHFVDTQSSFLENSSVSTSFSASVGKSTGENVPGKSNIRDDKKKETSLADEGNKKKRKRRNKQLTVVPDNTKDFDVNGGASKSPAEGRRKKRKSSIEPSISEYAEQNPVLDSNYKTSSKPKNDKKKKSFTQVISDMIPRPKKSNAKRNALRGQRSGTFK